MNLGDRMKFYEKNYTPSHLCHTLPILVRLDGKAFHSFTKGLKTPYDNQFMTCMDMTAKFLCEETNPRCAYVQSDEITLLYYSDSFESQVFMNAKRDKLNSVLASMCTLHFNGLKKLLLEDKVEQSAFFDCRCWNVPNKTEASNVFLWRQQDAIRNSILTLGNCYFSPKQLHNKSCDKIQDMVFKDYGINWNDLPYREKRGNFIRRFTEMSSFSKEELNKLPINHEARTTPELKVLRSKYRTEDIWLSKTANKESVLFDGNSPELFD